MAALQSTFRHNETVLREVNLKMCDHMTVYTNKEGFSRQPEALTYLNQIKIHYLMPTSLGCLLNTCRHILKH